MSDEGFAPFGKVIPEGEVFKTGSMAVGTFLFGPLVAGWMLYKNHRTFGQDALAKKSALASISFTAVLLAAALLVPGENTVGFFRLIPIVYTAAAILWMEKLQKDNIERYISDGGKQAGIRKIISVWLLGLAWLVVMASLIAAVFMFAGIIAFD